VGIIGFLLGLKNTFKIDTPVIKTTTANEQLAVVVPHHDLVKDKRAELLKKLGQNSQPETIILLSTNHFNAGAGNIVTSSRDWTVANGQEILSADTVLINKLTANNLATADNAVFDNEHGIKNLLGEIKEFFPNSNLIPIIIKDAVGQEPIKNLSDFLKDNCQNCGVIASVDMSHYQPAHVAEIHDIKTLRALTAGNEEEIWKTEVDSNASLAFLVAWAKARDLNNFVLFDHTNSGLLANNFDAETTTHIFGYFDASSAPVIDDSSLTFTFAGDAMFGREIGYQFQQNNFKDLFVNLGNRTFWGTDISWLNLEGPINSKVVPQPRHIDDLRFNFSNQTIEALKYLKLTTVSLANNHTLNQGPENLKTTQNILNNSGLDWQGNPNKPDEKSILRYEQSGIKLSLIAINLTFGINNINETIRQEKQRGQFVVVLPHWGNEYDTTHSAAQENLARSWFAAGADLIIGSHPHVIQDAQIIDGKLVFYSLGNFVFDQYFSKNTQQGLILTGQLSQEAINIALLPIESKRLKPERLRGDAKKEILDKVCKNITDFCHYDLIKIKRK
jgi:poly-gamma-glutamate synthesis protein (capsule biosynthesis protein)